MIGGIPYAGEWLALLTAVAWAFAVILFKKSGETVHPVALNLFKGVLATILFVPTVYLFGETLFYPASSGDYLLLLASGALGIGIADSLFLKCLNLLGAGLTSIVNCVYAPFLIGFSVVWLGESLTSWQIFGVAMIIGALLIATSRRNQRQVSRRDLALGVTLGVLAVAGTAVGIVVIKPLLNSSPLLWVTEIRLLGGLAMLGLILLFHPRRRAILSTLTVTTGWKYTVSGSFVGAYLAMVLWLAGMKFTQVSVAGVLNQMSNIFIFVFAAIFLSEPLDARRIIGIVLGVCGSLLMTFG
ncbi:MAG: DMT family transporter [candidate division Zixibacteria bacterium]|nr:DMT family transporter [candidate division Zixibacteria bacterium]